MANLTPPGSSRDRPTHPTSSRDMQQGQSQGMTMGNSIGTPRMDSGQNDPSNTLIAPPGSNPRQDVGGVVSPSPREIAPSPRPDRADALSPRPDISSQASPRVEGEAGAKIYSLQSQLNQLSLQVREKEHQIAQWRTLLKPTGMPYTFLEVSLSLE